MSEFSSDEKAFLRDLLRHPEWTSILAKLEGEARSRPFRPQSEKKIDLDAQVDHWKYNSGFDEGQKLLLNRLRNAN